MNQKQSQANGKQQGKNQALQITDQTQEKISKMIVPKSENFQGTMTMMIKKAEEMHNEILVSIDQPDLLPKQVNEEDFRYVAYDYKGTEEEKTYIRQNRKNCKKMANYLAMSDADEQKKFLITVFKAYETLLKSGSALFRVNKQYVTIPLQKYMNKRTAFFYAQFQTKQLPFNFAFNIKYKHTDVKDGLDEHRMTKDQRCYFDKKVVYLVSCTMNKIYERKGEYEQWMQQNNQEFDHKSFSQCMEGLVNELVLNMKGLTGNNNNLTSEILNGLLESQNGNKLYNRDVAYDFFLTRKPTELVKIIEEMQTGQELKELKAEIEKMSD